MNTTYELIKSSKDENFIKIMISTILKNEEIDNSINNSIDNQRNISCLQEWNRFLKLKSIL